MYEDSLIAALRDQPYYAARIHILAGGWIPSLGYRQEEVLLGNSMGDLMPDLLVYNPEGTPAFAVRVVEEEEALAWTEEGLEELVRAIGSLRAVLVLLPAEMCCWSVRARRLGPCRRLSFAAGEETWAEAFRFLMRSAEGTGTDTDTGKFRRLTPFTGIPADLKRSGLLCPDSQALTRLASLAQEGLDSWWQQVEILCPPLVRAPTEADAPQWEALARLNGGSGLRWEERFEPYHELLAPVLGAEANREEVSLLLLAWGMAADRSAGLLVADVARGQRLARGLALLAGRVKAGEPGSGQEPVRVPPVFLLAENA